MLMQQICSQCKQGQLVNHTPHKFYPKHYWLQCDNCDYIDPDSYRFVQNEEAYVNMGKEKDEE